MFKKIKKYIANATIKQKLIVMFSAFVLYPVLVVMFFGYFKYAKDIRVEIINTLEERIDRLNSLTAERFRQTKRYATMIPYDGTLNELYMLRKNSKEFNSHLFKSINSYLSTKLYSKQEVNAVYFYFLDDVKTVYMVQADNSYNNYIINTVHPAILEFADKMEGHFAFYISEDKEFYAIKKLYDRFSYKQYGMIILKIDKSYMLSHFNNDFENSSGILLTYNGTGIFEKGAISENDRADIIKEIDLGRSFEFKDKLFNFKPYEVICSNLKIDNITLKYGVIMPTSYVMDKYFDAVRLLVTLTIIVTLAMILAAIPLSKAMWSPIGELVGLMKLLEKGNFGVQSKRDKNDEFKYIFDSFNNMSNEIRKLFDVVYKEELARKESQLVALQARINPHFLYNTLEIMNWKARIVGNTELSEMIEALGTLMDAGMNKGGQSVYKIKEELKLVDSYMFIMHKRLGERLTFVKEIDETLLEGTIPKLLIQPLLENAMVHGLEPVGGGKLYLNISKIDKKLVVSVEDTGSGISDDKLNEYEKLFNGLPSKIKGSTGIGVKNVHERIQIIYGNDYGLCLKKGEYGGTLAIITIPYII